MMDQRPHAAEERSLGELLAELMQETTTLVRQELTLAKTEMSQKAARVGRDLGFLAAGGAIAYAGLLALVAAMVGLLAQVMPWWAAALIVGVVIAGVGSFLVVKGIQALKQEDLVPRETLDTLKEERGDSHGIRNRAAGLGG